MSTTPNRLQIACGNNFSPVQVKNSPKSTKNDPLGLKPRLNTIARQTLENHGRWNAAHQRGLTLCRQIENIKKPLLISGEKPESLYPDALKSPSSKLKIITTIFEDIINDTAKLLQHLDSIKSLQESLPTEQLLLKTWLIDRVIKTINDINEAYQSEYNVKKIIMENIPHSRSQDELSVHVTFWLIPCYVNEELLLKLKTIKNECDL